MKTLLTSPEASPPPTFKSEEIFRISEINIINQKNKHLASIIKIYRTRTCLSKTQLNFTFKNTEQRPSTLIPLIIVIKFLNNYCTNSNGNNQVLSLPLHSAFRTKFPEVSDIL